MIGDPSSESETGTRRGRVDPKLAAQGWSVFDFVGASELAKRSEQAVAECPTVSSPADYVFCRHGESFQAPFGRLNDPEMAVMTGTKNRC